MFSFRPSWAFRAGAVAVIVLAIAVNASPAFAAELPVDGGQLASTPTESQLLEFLKANEAVEILARGLNNLDEGPGHPQPILGPDKTFKVKERGGFSPGATPGSGTLTISGNRISGDGTYATEKGRKPFQFRINVLGLTSNRMSHDLEKVCLGSDCIVERDLCWQSTGEGETHDCTARPVYSALIKPTTAKILSWLALVDPERDPDVFLERGAGLLLRHDGTFRIWDMNNSMSPCSGHWTISSNQITGRCVDESFSLTIDRLAPNAVVYHAKRCSRGHCDPEEVGCWGRRYGVQDDGCGGTLVETIPGTRDRALFEAVVQRLRTSYSADWRAAGLKFMPLLFVGPQARKLRIETQVFYAEDSRPAAEAVAKLLAPTIGPVKIEPWPGKCDYHVVVVVGESRSPNG